MVGKNSAAEDRPLLSAAPIDDNEKGFSMAKYSNQADPKAAASETTNITMN